MMKRMVMLPDGTPVPALGQGTWFLGENLSLAGQEKEALKAGIKAGMILIDTAEMYGEGASECLIGETIRDIDRKKLFLVSKVYPHNAGREAIFKSCTESLKRLGTDYLDLYLLHWRGRIRLEETVDCMEQLKAAGKIRNWGVSNFDTEDMKELRSVPGGTNCAVDQVLYHVAARGIEYDLLPWMRERGIPLMAYCPLAQGGKLNRGMYKNPTLNCIADRHRVSVSQILLAFVLRYPNVIAIPRSSRKDHTLDNAGADTIVLTEEELTALDRAFPAPDRKIRLGMV